MNESPANDATPPDDLAICVRRALAEDTGENTDGNMGRGDITAALIPAERRASARIICREPTILCGQPWANEVFATLSPDIRIDWLAKEGAAVTADTVLCRLQGPARALLTGERTALNFLQTLSATATAARRYADLVAHTSVRLLDTRKTLPGLRSAQKYAVRTGGCHNHRQGLFDAFLIKENHIAACGSIGAAIRRARADHPQLTVEVEIETLVQLGEALDAGADTIMLDNFTLADMREAVRRRSNHATRLEASGGIEDDATLVAIAETGVDDISIGALTKHITAIDMSMRLDQ